MAQYGGYNNNQDGGYGQAAPPYPEDNVYGNNNAYGRDSYGAQQGQSVELEPLAQNGQQFGSRAQDPNAILNECRAIDRSIDDIDRNLEQIRMLQQRSLDDPDSSNNSSTNRQLEAIGSETMTMYRSLAARIKSLMGRPGSDSPINGPQLGKVNRKLKQAINDYQQLESTYRKKLQEQMARQYRIVRPEASEEEVREAVEDTSNQQVFSQALLQSDRRGQSRAALSAVENRHVAIQKIERQMIELAQLFQDMEEQVVRQEDVVTEIEQKGEEVQENLKRGTEEIGTAIKTARGRNKKKWWCLGISVTIIVVIVVIVVVVKVVDNKTQNTAPAKRSIEGVGEVEKRGAEEELVNAVVGRLARGIAGHTLRLPAV